MTADALIWLSTEQVSDRTGRHAVTIRRAAESGELHGSQRVPGGRWRFHRDCADAWAGQQPCPHAEAPSAQSA